ncbi:MAG: LytTR family transcriptional regulator [Acidobacteriia bacterium]|nr:LytTR family transcriptional regulator [Terriglobia bacterium]
MATSTGPCVAPHGADAFPRPAGDVYRVVPQAEVVYFGSDGGLTKRYTAGHRYAMEPTRNDFEQRLDPAVFFRVSRTAIVNLDFIRFGQATPKSR